MDDFVNFGDGGERDAVEWPWFLLKGDGESLEQNGDLPEPVEERYEFGEKQPEHMGKFVLPVMNNGVCMRWPRYFFMK